MRASYKNREPGQTVPDVMVLAADKDKHKQ